MPTYTYRCVCGRKLDSSNTIANRHTGAPWHCDEPMQLEIQPTMVAVFEPYRAVGREKRWIQNRDEHRAYLREHGYEEVGNDASRAPPPISDQEHAYNQQQQIREMQRDQEETARVVRELGVNLAINPRES
jgi:hypothetical protein